MKTPKQFAVISSIALLTVISLSHYSNEIYASEVYRGVGNGHNGDIVVEMDVRDGDIIRLEVVETQESPFAVEIHDQMIQEVYETRSLELDTVTGATFTFDGTIEAIKDAAVNAGFPLL